MGEFSSDELQESEGDLFRTGDLGKKRGLSTFDFLFPEHGESEANRALIYNWRAEPSAE